MSDEVFGSKYIIAPVFNFSLLPPVEAHRLAMCAESTLLPLPELRGVYVSLEGARINSLRIIAVFRFALRDVLWSSWCLIVSIQAARMLFGS